MPELIVETISHQSQEDKMNSINLYKQYRVPKIVAKDGSTLREDRSKAKPSKLKQIANRESLVKQAAKVIPAQNKSIFPKPPREMIWKKINGKLVAEWTAIS